ncbi:hypothetical protein VTI74DRAFT_4245 [Chaetomium olivicolor]
MPPPIIPFPYPLRVGTDICRIPRVLRILRGPRPARFIHRVLAPEELLHARPAVQAVLDHLASDAAKAAGVGVGRTPPLLDGQAGSSEEDGTGAGAGAGTVEDEELYRRAAAHLAGRWAAKEAVFKAHPHLRLGFHDVLILTPAQMAQVVPELAAERLHHRRRDSAPLALIKTGKGGRSQMAEVSISHDWGYATATCIGFEAGLEWGAMTAEESKGGWFSRLSRIWWSNK